jgi:lipoate-protein ligase B
MNIEVNNESVGLDIRIFSLTSGKSIIGDYVKTDLDQIIVKCPLEIKKICTEHSNSLEIFIPIISNSDNEPCTIFIHSIESMMNASEEVKDKYIKTLIMNRLKELFNQCTVEDGNILFDPSH